MARCDVTVDAMRRAGHGNTAAEALMEACAASEPAPRRGGVEPTPRAEPTAFTLDKVQYTFENPVSWVLAAARQLGMAVRRDAALLWIADEALVDELDHEPLRLLSQLPRHEPLSDEVCHFYETVFQQRLSAPFGRAASSGSISASSSASSDDESAESPKTLGQAGKSSAERRLLSRRVKRERRRRELALGAARLSNIVERYTAEQALVDESEALPAAAAVCRSPKAAAPAMWPGEGGSSRAAREVLMTLPRIDSLSKNLEQLDVQAAAAAGAPAAHEPEGDAEQARPGSSSAIVETGAVVEVDFDDEGWLRGVVRSVESAADAGVRYAVELESGELAEDVTASEIRRIFSGAGSSSSGESRIARTRDDTFSVFELEPSDDDASDAEPETPHAQMMQYRVTDSGVDWTILEPSERDPVTWSSPTVALLRKHTEKQCDGEGFLPRY